MPAKSRKKRSTSGSTVRKTVQKARKGAASAAAKTRKAASTAAKKVKKAASNPRRTVTKAADSVHASATRARDVGQTAIAAGEVLTQAAEFIDSMALRAKAGAGQRKSGSRSKR